MHAKLRQSCLTLCDSMDCSLPGSAVHGILQARVLERVAMPSSRGSSQLRDQRHISYSSCIAGRFFTAEPVENPQLSTAAAAKSLQSCLTHSDPMDCSPPGSSIHGILQARVLEWGAIAFSKLSTSRGLIWASLIAQLVKNPPAM